jgi:transcriptional regulator with XRE-family HTH domain
MKKRLLDKIKKIRIENGISHEAIAHHLDISQVAYSKIEKGETKLTIDRLIEIADILDAQFPEDFFEMPKENDSATIVFLQGLLAENTSLYNKLLESKEEQIRMLKQMLKNN